MAIFGALVLSAIIVGGRMIWRYYHPVTEIVDAKPISSWLDARNGRVFMVLLVVIFVMIFVYRLGSVQNPPNNLEHPPSRAARK